MNFVVYTNPKRDSSNIVTSQVVAQLERYDLQYYCVRQPQDILSHDLVGDSCLLTIGGDGTILHSVFYSVQGDMPILGVNKGMLGFLTEVDLEHIPIAIQSIKDQKYKVDSKTLLCFEHECKTHFALNEIVVSRSASNLVRTEVLVNNDTIDQYSGDGFIVATPTGSTAYSLSAGGSIVGPNTPAIALTPINAHTLWARPMIVGDDNSVVLRLLSRQAAYIFVDGVNVGKLRHNQELFIKKYDKRVKFVRINGFDTFYQKLYKKLRGA